MSDPEDLAVTVRAVLEQVGGLHPAVAEDAPVTKLPAVVEPWLTVLADRLQISLVVHADALPGLPRLLAAHTALTSALATTVELRVVDVVERAPDQS